MATASLATGDMMLLLAGDHGRPGIDGAAAVGIRLASGDTPTPESAF